MANNSDTQTVESILSRPRGRGRKNSGNPTPTTLEQMANRDALARALDYFTNIPARMGYGTANLAEAAEYELVRQTLNYWQLVTLYENHWISAKIVDTPATDMVKAWPRLTSDIDPEDLTRIARVLRVTQTRINLLTAMKWGRLFGGAGALIVIDGQEDRLDEPVDYDSVGPGDYKGLIPFDRWTGIYPEGEISTDISRPVDFNRPKYYRVNVTQGGQTFDVHCSRVLRFTGPEMPTPEREAHSWWGISEITRAFEEIRKRDNMSWNILSLTFRAQILGIKDEQLQKMLSGVGAGQQAAAQWAGRIQQINELMSNQSLLMLGKEGDLHSVNYTFTGLSECYQQFQLDISGATGIPVTRLFGRTITGLGQSNDADERIYEERISSDQEVYLRPQLEKLYPVICMSALGEIPDDLDFNFPSVRVLDEKEKTELAKAVVDTISVAFQNGVISKQTFAKELKQSSDITGVFTNITDEEIAKLPDTVDDTGEFGGLLGGPGGEPGSGGEGDVPNLSPSASPQKVLKETAKNQKKEEKELEPLEPSEEEERQDDRRLKALARAADAESYPWDEQARIESDYERARREGGSPADVARRMGLSPPAYSEPPNTAREVAQLGKPLSELQRQAEFEDWARRKGISIPEFPGDSASRAHDADRSAKEERTIDGMPIVIEYRAGEERSGKDWSITLPYDYGYLDGVTGADGDSLDVCLGEGPSDGMVYVIDQRHVPPKTGFDEHKCMMNYPSQAAALKAYDAGHNRAREVFMDWTAMPVAQFKEWAKTADLSKPAGDMQA